MDIIKLSKKELIEICHRIVEEIIYKHPTDYNDDIISKYIKKELNECEVVHQKDSSKKYGNGSEYEGYKTWIDYWKKNSPIGKQLDTIKRCPCCGKNLTTKEIVGGHVKSINGNHIYVTPICKDCNSKAAQNESFRNKPFKVKRKYLVPFNYNELKDLRNLKQS